MLEEAPDASPGVALEAPLELSFGPALLESPFDVGLGSGAAPGPGGGHEVQGRVELAVAAPVEAVSDGFTG
jgi:hypothetical protein